MLISSARTDGQPTPRPRDWAAAQWQEWQKEARSFEAIAAYRWSFNFLVLETAANRSKACGDQRLFPCGSSQPVLGRTFLESDTWPTRRR